MRGCAAGAGINCKERSISLFGKICCAAGEQQRLGMARLFFHNPKLGVLDECTNATSVDVEEHLYRCILS